MNKLLMIIIGLMLLSLNVFADDVSIDSNGNVKTGVSNTIGNLEVTGESGEDAIAGFASDMYSVGVYGLNSATGNYGTLGDYVYGVYGFSSTGFGVNGYSDGGIGVYGSSDTGRGVFGSGSSGFGVYGSSISGTAVYGWTAYGWAGYFQGNTKVTGNLTVDGTVSGPNIGDITAVTAGTGLSGGGASGNVTLNVNTTAIQQRVTGTCAAGSSIRTVNADGTVVCETDDGITAETDPRVGVLTNGMWCTSNGTQVNCTTSAPVTSESDPQVGSNTTNYVPKWNGSSLASGTIYDNGNIGIGTVSPSDKLEVAGNLRFSAGTDRSIVLPDGTRSLYIGNGTAPWSIWLMSDSYLNFRTAGADRLRIRNDGNVGIGTTVPGSKLTVAGTIESTTGGVMFPDSTVQTTAAAPSWHQILSAADRFVLVMNNEAVLDKETGLVWERSTIASTYNWYQAVDQCINKSLGGRKGWRLATIEEYTTLVDPAQSNPALPVGHLFTNLQATYWSSTTYHVGGGCVDCGYTLNINNGNASGWSNKTSNYYIRCVRGGHGHDGY